MPRDLYADVTARIINALEAGTPPWVRPWSATPEAMPMNALSRRAYRGVNFVLLSLHAMHQGYSRNRWLTYLQATSLGGYVRAGEHGTTVVFWKRREETPSVESGPAKPSGTALLRAYSVFNVSQIGGLPAAIYAPALPPSWPPTEAAERLLDGSGATIVHGSPSAFYQPVLDRIHLPEKRTFPKAEGYYATALHELTHWTGHESRCNRQLKVRFGEAAYAMEELVAEMGSAFLCAHCRIDGQLQHAAYLRSWLSVLRQDKRAIFTAAAKAQDAADYVLHSEELVSKTERTFS